MAVEPWLRGTLTEVDALKRQVLHALELTGEDIERWCAGLGEAEIHARPYRLPSVAFHLRHIARSLDRLLTYAAGRPLTALQHEQLRIETDEQGTANEIMDELREGLRTAARRVHTVSPESYEEPRGVGRDLLPSTVAGLLIHCAEHTQRHSGQAMTTARVVAGMRATTV